MEGITRVLQAARLLTDEHLAPNDEYGLVVCMLDAIGVSRGCMNIFLHVSANNFALSSIWGAGG